MEEGTGLSLYMLIGAIMFGLFSGATAIFGDEVGSFVGGLVETVKDREPNEGEGIVEEEDDSNCVLATDEDFNGRVHGDYKYIGRSDCVKIPHVIKGDEVTSYRNMFKGTSVSKVISDNPNVTDMFNMFRDSKATELDLSNFDTSNATDMSYMFQNSQATELDVSNFDTSNVTNMWRMFRGTKATELDLSSFNTSKVSNMTYMFYESEATVIDVSSLDTSNVMNMVGMFYNSKATEIKGLEKFDTRNVIDMSHMFFRSKATELDLSSFNTSKVINMSGIFGESETKTVYARTQLDADKFNASINKPIGLQVIVKQ